MKFILTCVLGIFTTLLLVTNAKAVEIYTFDPTHTYILWHINHFGFSSPSGKWMINGKLSLDEKKPQNSEVSAIIHIADIDTGVAALDEHLKSKAFFDAEQYPTATFASSNIVLVGKNKAKVSGILTLHGISKPILLTVALNKIGISPITQKKTIGFSGTTTLKRSDFGINTLVPALGDTVAIEIQMEGQLQ